jgi:AraC-like DNA-binding protein
MNREWSRYYRQPALHDLEVLHARFVDHRFARHSHDYYVIGYVESGVQAFSYQGARHITPAGQIFLVNPGEPHTGEAATPDGYVYRTVYPRATLMQSMAAEVVTGTTIPLFKCAVVRDDALAARVARFHRAFADGEPSLAVESHLVSALTHLVRHYADRPRVRASGLNERDAIRRAREYINAHFDTDVSLSQLSALAHLSPFYFARAFTKAVGLPPHAYLEAVRIQKARELIDSGAAIADTAVAVGYADQSHFTCRFKRVLGITPGQFARDRRPRSPSVAVRCAEGSSQVVCASSGRRDTTR